MSETVPSFIDDGSLDQPYSESIADRGMEAGENGTQGGNSPLANGLVFDVFDPINFTTESADPGTGSPLGESGGRRRGRPPGSRNRNGSGAPGTVTAKTGPKVSPLLANLEDLLFSVHMMGSTLLKVSELEITKDQAKRLSDAVADVASYYNVAVSPKTLAISRLAAIAGEIYIPVGIAVYKREVTTRPPKLTLIKNDTPKAEPVLTVPFPSDFSKMTPSQLWNEPAATGDIPL